MRFLEVLKGLIKLLRELSKTTGQPGLEVVALLLAIFALLCIAGIFVIAISLSALERLKQPRTVRSRGFTLLGLSSPAKPTRGARRSELVVVLGGSFVSYMVWIACSWCFLILLTPVLDILAFQSPEIPRLTVLVCAYTFHLISIVVICNYLFFDTMRTPRLQSCAVGLLFIIYDVLVVRYSPVPLSLRLPVATYVVTLWVASFPDFFFMVFLLAPSVLPSRRRAYARSKARRSGAQISRKPRIDIKATINETSLPQGNSSRVFIVTPEGVVFESDKGMRH
jgi:hypothetical protein